MHLIDDWFQSLHDKLELISQKWSKANRKEKEDLSKQLLQLRQDSDRVIDLWLQLEERLSEVIQQVKGSATDTYPSAKTACQVVKGLGNWSEEGKNGKWTAVSLDTHEKQETQTIHDQYHLFRKGEGFYHLRLFHDAKRCFANLVRESPDFERGRLYYAYTLLFSNETEAAMKEFRLLGKTASSPQIVAISLNAIGCLLAEEQQWLEAKQAFMEAIETKPDHTEALFNLALYHLQDGEAEEALDVVKTLLDKSPDDWEAHMVSCRAELMLDDGQVNTGEVFYSSLPFDKEDLEGTKLHEMARLYDQSGQIDYARVCYQMLTEKSPLDGYGWHGLAYTAWLTCGVDVALPKLKKAVTLAPQNLDFLFTYGWMHIYKGELEKASDIFSQILQKDPDHRLTQSGMIAYYLRRGEILEAKRLAGQFLQDEDPYLQSLGYYHLGTIHFQEQNWLIASTCFDKAKQLGGRFPELSFYDDICRIRTGSKSISPDSSLLQT